MADFIGDLWLQFAGAIPWVLGLLLIAAAAFMAWAVSKGHIRIKRLMKFPIRVISLAMRQGAIKVDEDRAVRVTDPATKRETYFLKSNGREIQAFTLSNILPGDVLLVFSPAVGEYWPTRCIPKEFNYTEQVPVLDDQGIPLVGENGEPKMQAVTKTGYTLDIKPIMDESVKYLWAQRQRENLNRFIQQSFLEKYGGMLLFFVAMIISLFMLQSVAGAVTGVGGQMAAAIHELITRYPAPTVTPIVGPGF